MNMRNIQQVNAERCEAWYPIDDWNLMEWSACMAGEAGEACNVAKKLRRIEDGVKRNPDENEDELREQLGEEIADTITYAFLLASRAGIDVQDVFAKKFNKVSEKFGFPQRIEPELPDEIDKGDLIEHRGLSYRVDVVEPAEHRFPYALVASPVLKVIATLEESE